MSVALLVLPDFLLVALGWLLRHKLGFNREFFAGLERMVYFVLFPAMLFKAILRTPISDGIAWLLLQATATVVAAGVALAGLGGWVLRAPPLALRSDENTYELQSLMRI